MRDGQKIALVGGVFAALVGTAGVGAYVLFGGDDGPAGDAKQFTAADARTSDGPAPTGPPTAKEVNLTAQGFLSSWEGGDTAGAAGMTDDEQTAAKALTGFGENLGIDRIALRQGTPSGGTVPFTVTAQVSWGEQGERATWSYKSALTVVRKEDTGEPVVGWKPSVLHPELKPGESISTGDLGDPPPVKTLDRDGGELTAEQHPALAGVLADLAERYGEKVGGTPPQAIRIVDAEGEPRKSLLELSEGEAGTLQTTIDPQVQQAAEQAVAGKAKAAVTAVRPSTGEILALANSPAKGFNTALLGQYAPGSTMKIVTASMLIDKGLAGSSSPHPCPKYFTHGGWKFHNLDKFKISNGTFAQSFAASCNTAFISQAPELGDDDLTKHSRDVFGIGLNWQVGVATFDGQVPVQQHAQMAASLIGQGGVRVNPLIMASVSATVKNGSFKQPHLIDPSVDGRALAQASRALNPGTAQQLRDLMRLTATSGTAAQAMAGLSGDIGAKTGSAEVQGQEKPNAWFTGYRGDLAASAVVPESGHGGTHAGPVVRQVLAAGG